MLKLSCHVSKKLPVPGRDFSSQSFACGIEAELADAADVPALKAKAEELFSLVQRAVEDEIAKASAAAAHETAAEPEGWNGHAQAVPAAGARVPRTPPANGGNGHGQRSNRRGQMVPATAAQIRAIKGIAAEQELDLAAVLAPFQVNSPAELTIRDASRLIDDLKARKANGNSR